MRLHGIRRSTGRFVQPSAFTVGETECQKATCLLRQRLHGKAPVVDVHNRSGLNVHKFRAYAMRSESALIIGRLQFIKTEPLLRRLVVRTTCMHQVVKPDHAHLVTMAMARCYPLHVGMLSRKVVGIFVAFVVAVTNACLTAGVVYTNMCRQHVMISPAGTLTLVSNDHEFGKVGEDLLCATQTHTLLLSAVMGIEPCNLPFTPTSELAMCCASLETIYTALKPVWQQHGIGTMFTLDDVSEMVGLCLPCMTVAEMFECIARTLQNTLAIV